MTTYATTYGWRSAGIRRGPWWWAEADVKVFEGLNLDLPEGSIICADKAYTDYDYEDLLEEVGLHLKAQRKKNSKRPMPSWEEFLGKPTLTSTSRRSLAN